MSAIRDAITSYKSSKGRAVYKPFSYIPIYEHYLERYCIGPVVALAELGIGFGGCLQMWQDYLGPTTHIIGIDKKDQTSTRQLAEEGFTLYFGDQGDPDFLDALHNDLPPLDIFIDDGSHVCSHQIQTLEKLFSNVKRGGLYFIEDVHTSYRPALYGGEYHGQGSMIEYAKDLIDLLYHPEDPRILGDNEYLQRFANLIDWVHFYPSLIIIKKKDPDA